MAHRRAPSTEASSASENRCIKTEAAGPNQVWAYDFVFDTCSNGQQLKCLTVVDEWTREALAIDVAGSIRSTRLIEVLGKLIRVHGAPKDLRWHLASRGRMAPTRVSTAAFATSA